LKMEIADYKNRSYLSAIEAAKFLNISVRNIHALVKIGKLKAKISTSGQMRFELQELQNSFPKSAVRKPKLKKNSQEIFFIEINGTVQKVINKSAVRMEELTDNSVHLMICSPPYFNTKMYSGEPITGDLGNIHDIEEWFKEIGRVWSEVFRVLQPGRKAFINIMNLPIRNSHGGFRTINLAGRTVELCEKIGFIFKRDIIWHKTNSVRAHFGTYPYPGGILINHMHEFILEFDKPCIKGLKKYDHLTKEQKEQSKIDKHFWLEIKKSDVWVMKPQPSGDNRKHIAPFPYELPFRLIKAFSYVSETVLDPFSGSGTTLAAAADLKRNGIGYEINPDIAAESAFDLQRRQPGLW